MGYPTRELLNYIRHYLIPRSYELENEIEEIGDLFPTFSGTYPEVMNILLDQRRQMEFVLPIMESALDSPSYQYRIKKIKPHAEQTFRDRQLCFYVRKLVVSEKTQKSELCHFS